MATVAYQLREMCVREDWGWEETQLVYNHIKSAWDGEWRREPWIM